MEEVTCNHCGKVYLRPPNKINEAIKFGWKQYCSPSCLSKSRNRQKEFKCGNSECNKSFKRAQKDIPSSGTCFCSKSCSAKVNNKIRELNRPKKYCANQNCGNIIKTRNTYCSVKCQWIVNSVSNEEYKEIIIDRIKEFHKTHGRIPLKQEMWGIHKPARKIFQTWNKAIIAAGFEPNPVRFANKYIANDGHKCDSMAEKIIDDYLSRHNIKHETKVIYNHHRMSADFKIGDTYIEFFGLQGELESYDRLIKEKERLWKEKNLKVIKIYPNDLFPKNKLSQIFATLRTS